MIRNHPEHMIGLISHGDFRAELPHLDRTESGTKSFIFAIAFGLRVGRNIIAIKGTSAEVVLELLKRQQDLEKKVDELEKTKNSRQESAADP